MAAVCPINDIFGSDATVVSVNTVYNLFQIPRAIIFKIEDLYELVTSTFLKKSITQNF